MVAMVDSFRANVLNKWVATLSFHTTLRTYWTLVQCPFSRLNWFNTPRSWIILRWVFRRAQASCSLELELYASAIINCVHTNERSINVMLQPFDWMNTHNLCIFALNFVLNYSRWVLKGLRVGKSCGKREGKTFEQQQINGWQSTPHPI